MRMGVISENGKKPCLIGSCNFFNDQNSLPPSALLRPRSLSTSYESIHETFEICLHCYASGLLPDIIFLHLSRLTAWSAIFSIR